MTKRAFLMLGVAGLFATGVTRVGATTPAQIDVEGYGGASSGEWTCGPAARAKYAGVGGNVRVYVSETDAGEREPEGLSVHAGGGVESRGYEPTGSEPPPGEPAEVLPPTRALAGARAGLGWDSRYFGVHAGAMIFQRWDDANARVPVLTPLPELDLRFARRRGLHGGLSVGSYDVPTLFRPGGSAYLAYMGESGWLLDVRGGPHLIFDEDPGFRGALSFRHPIGSFVSLGAGAAVNGGSQWLPEGRLFLSFTP